MILSQEIDDKVEDLINTIRKNLSIKRFEQRTNEYKIVIDLKEFSEAKRK